MDEEEFFDEGMTGELESDNTPDRLSPEWSDFVMTHFREDELVNISEDGSRQAPNVAGLRRVTELLMGPIISSRVVDFSNGGDYMSAAASYEVSISTSYGVVTFGDAADVNAHNCDTFFQKFATACAVTRAEARALRKALKLKTVAAEEVDKTYKKKDRDEDKPTSGQLNFLRKGFKKANVNGIKFIKKVTGGNGELTHEQATAVLIALQKHTNQGEEVPKSLQGYQDTWDANL
jgi:hypothetical protein